MEFIGLYFLVNPISRFFQRNIYISIDTDLFLTDDFFSSFSYNISDILRMYNIILLFTKLFYCFEMIDLYDLYYFRRTIWSENNLDHVVNISKIVIKANSSLQN